MTEAEARAITALTEIGDLLVASSISGVAMKGNPEEAVLGLQSSPFVRSSADGELLTQGSVLQRQRGLRHERGPEESEQG